MNTILLNQIQDGAATICDEILTKVIESCYCAPAVDIVSHPILGKYCSTDQLCTLIYRCLNGNDLSRQYHMRLLSSFAKGSGVMKSVEILVRIISTATNDDALSSFISLLVSIAIYHPNIVHLLLTHMCSCRQTLIDERRRSNTIDTSSIKIGRQRSQLEEGEHDESIIVSTSDIVDECDFDCLWLRNLCKLIVFERNADENYELKNIGFSLALSDAYGQLFSDILSFAISTDRTLTIYESLRLMSVVEPSLTLLPRFGYKLVHQFAQIAFVGLQRIDTVDGLKLFRCCCRQAFDFVDTQPICCREIFMTAMIDQAFNNSIGLFTSVNTNTTTNTVSLASEDRLIDTNRKSIASRNIAALVHSGVIGRGAKRAENQSLTEISVVRRLLFVDAMDSFCQKRQTEANLIVYNLTTCRQLTIALNDRLCFDSISAYFIWDEWSIERESVPRYIEVNKRVQTIPFAIDLLFLIAEAYPCLWFAMPVVKAILASLMIQLETGVDKTKRLKSDTKLLNDIDRWFLLVSKGLLLPQKLGRFIEIVSRVTTYEAFVILHDIWCYFQSIAPDISKLNHHFNELQVSVAIRAEPLTGESDRFMDNCRLVIQRNISTLGYLYPKLFTIGNENDASRR